VETETCQEQLLGYYRQKHRFSVGAGQLFRILDKIPFLVFNAIKSFVIMPGFFVNRQSFSFLR
jgi:hypothetical protein